MHLMIIFETEDVYQEKNSCKQNKSHNIVFDAINKSFRLIFQCKYLKEKLELLLSINHIK